MSNPAPTLNQINAFNATQGTTIDFNIIGGTEVIRSNKIYIYDLSDNSLICTHLYVSTESIHELPPNISSSIIYEDGKTSADFTNNTQYYAQIQTFTDVGGTQGGSGLSIAKLFWCLPTPTLTLSTIPTTISTTSYNVSATYTSNTSGGATNEIQEFQFNLYSAIGALLQTSGVVLYGEGVDLSYNFSGLEVDSTYYVTLDVTTTQGMNVSVQSDTFTVSIDTPTMGSASVVNNGCDGYISVTSNLSSEYEHEESAEAGEIMSFTTDSVNDITELDVDFSPVQDGTPWMSAQDTEPYMFRAVPTQTEDFGHESDTIVGGTVAWNQLIPNSIVGNGNNANVEYDSDTKTTTITPTSFNSNAVGAWRGSVLKPTHKYFTSADYYADYAVTARLGSGADITVQNPASEINVQKSIPATTWTNVAGIFRTPDASASTSFICYTRVAAAGWTQGTFKFRNVQVFDLTQMFGSTIADYIYSLEQATAGAGVAWFRKLFSKPYYEYNAGELMSVNASSHDMVGFNQWDEEWEGGYINDNGQNANTSAAIRSKNYIKVLPNTSYCITVPSAAYMRYYDADKNFISKFDKDNKGNCGAPFSVRTTHDNCYYIRFYIDGTTYNNDICINLSNTSLNGTYKPYVKHSYPLDSSLTLRGIPKLDTNNNLYYDGDTYASDGTVTRKYGIVDLGTLNWTYDSSVPCFGVSFTSAKPTADNNTIANIINAKYTAITMNVLGASASGVIALSSGSYMRIKDTAYTDAASFKTAMSGAYLVYELATPTTETADAYTNPQIVDPSGTEEYVGSPIPVGHETTYQRICPINGWDSVEVDVVGVNLCYKVLSNPLSLVNVNYAKVITGAGTTAVFKAVKGQTYRVSGATGRNRSLIAYFDSDPVIDSVSNSAYQSPTQDYSDGYLFTAQRTAYCACYLANSVLADVNIQIELGSTTTLYQPYNGTTYTSTFPKYKQQVSQDTTPYITKNIGDTYADTLTENLVGGTIAWNQSVPDTTTTHTISGSIASMDDAVAGNFESVVCDIEPVQDLHGYDKPWVGGSGKNKLHFESKTYSVNDVTFTQTEDNSIVVNGTASGDIIYNVKPYTNGNTAADHILLSELFDIQADTAYVLSGCPLGGSASTYRMQLLVYGSGAEPIDVGSGSNQFSFTASDIETKKYRLCIRIQSGTVCNNLVFKPMIRLATESDATFAPWENLCPITGWTGCNVSQSPYEQTEKHTITGKNIYNAPNNQHDVLVPCHIANGVTVTASCASSGAGIRYYNSNKEEIDYWTLVNVAPNGRYYRNFTTSGGIEFVKFYGANSTKYMIELNTASPSDYEPYGYHFPVSWQTEAGTVYGGTVDVVSGVLTVDRAKYDLSQLTWTFDSTRQRWVSAVDNTLKKNTSGNTLTGAICDSLEEHTPNEIANNQTIIGFSITANPNITLRNGDTVNSPTGNIVAYLATPTTYQLDPVQVACLLGQNNVWADCGDVAVTYPTNHSYQSLSTTHKYYKRINGVESISVGSDVVVDVGTDNIIDLTQMFGTTIADYIYNIEQSSSSGMGVKFFKSLFPNNDYDYNSGELISVNASAHVIKDANGNVLHTYPLDSDLVLRGIPKLDANNKLYYDGDVYEPSGSVTRKYGIVDLGTLDWQFVTITYDNTPINVFRTDIDTPPNMKTHGRCLSTIYTNIDGTYSQQIAYVANNDKSAWVGASYWSSTSLRLVVRNDAYNDASAFKTAMSGVYLVYELATSTTEQADPFEENQAIVPNGIEEYVVTEQGDVEMPVGHDSTYYTTSIYSGTIDMAKGVLTINMVSVDMGMLNWVYVSNGSYFYAIISNKAKGFDNIVCNVYENASQAGVANLQNGQIVGGMNDTAVYVKDSRYTDAISFKASVSGYQLVYELATPIEISFTPQQIQTLSGQNNIWSNTNGGMYLVYQLPITSLLVKRRDVADVSGKWLTLYSIPITQASDMDFTFIDFLNQYGKTYQYALVPVLEQDQSGVIVQIEGGYTVSDNVDSIFDGVYIADQTNVERVKAGVGYGNIDMNQGVGSITPIGSKYPIVITNSQNQYHNGSIRGTIVPNDFYSNGNLSRINMVNKRDELEQFLTNKRAKIIKDWNGKIWLVMIMSNVACSFDDNYGMGMVSFSADWLEVGDPTNQQDLYNAGLINVGGV